MDFPIQTDETLEYNRPDITAIEKKNRKCPLIDPARPFDTRTEKQNAQIIVIWSMKLQKFGKWKRYTSEVIPVVIGALGTVTKHLEKWIEKLDMDLTIEVLQKKPCLLGMARIMRSVGYEMVWKKSYNT